jgi:hypothetical protein
MNAITRALGWAGLGLGCALSPAIVTLGVPLGYGIGSDIVESAWRAPIALVIAVAIACNAWRRRDAAQAAKSIT